MFQRPINRCLRLVPGPARRLGSWLLLLCCGVALALPSSLFAAAADEGAHGLLQMVQPLMIQHPGQSGLYVLEKGEEALLARAWLADHATGTIDVQYFIWSSDNVGVLAAEALLRAADRGVKVRVIIDDLLVDAPSEAMLALARHPGIEMRIYNPQHKVGTTRARKLANVATDFRGVNQRMHDKTALFDGVVGITGGRNMADEYYDYNQRYTFRDRDVLAMGPVVAEMESSFERFWKSSQTQPVEQLLPKQLKKLTPERVGQLYADLHAYAGNPENFAPEVRRALENLPEKFAGLQQALLWDEVRFLSDLPGKNSGQDGLGGGGRTTSELLAVVQQAQRRITIESPYLVLSEEGLAVFRELVRRGVAVRIVTNSLAATDNLMAYSGYRGARQALLEAGIEVHEFRPDPPIRQALIERYPQLKDDPPLFAIHAKTLVVDGETLYIGTFNLDPRSANLNTEVGVLVANATLARQVEERIEQDMLPENSWNPALENPDGHAPLAKRMKLRFWRLLPLEPLL